MKLLFLDIDGVLTTDVAIKNRIGSGLPTCDRYGELFDDTTVDNLKMIIETIPDVRIVIESTWKLHGISELRKMWKDRNLPGNIYGITKDAIDIPDLLDFDLSDPDNLDLVMGQSKGLGIKLFLENIPDSNNEYVIIDDAKSFLPEQLSHLVCTNHRIGLTAEDARKAIMML